MQAVAPKVEKAVFEPDVFRVVRLAEHRQRQFLGLGLDGDLRHLQLDVAG